LYEMMRQCGPEGEITFHAKHPDYAKDLTRLLKTELVTKMIEITWRLSIELLEMQLDIRKRAIGDEKKQFLIGLKWRRKAGSRPANGVQLTNALLLSALKTKLEFTEAEWYTFGVANLSKDHFVKDYPATRAHYYQPVAEDGGFDAMELVDGLEDAKVAAQARMERAIVEMLFAKRALKKLMDRQAKAKEDVEVAAVKPKPKRPPRNPYVTPPAMPAFGREPLLDAMKAKVQKAKARAEIFEHQAVRESPRRPRAAEVRAEPTLVTSEDASRRKTAIMSKMPHTWAEVRAAAPATILKVVEDVPAPAYWHRWHDQDRAPVPPPTGMRSQAVLQRPASAHATTTVVSFPSRHGASLPRPASAHVLPVYRQAPIQVAARRTPASDADVRAGVRSAPPLPLPRSWDERVPRDLQHALGRPWQHR